MGVLNIDNSREEEIDSGSGAVLVVSKKEYEKYRCRVSLDTGSRPVSRITFIQLILSFEVSGW